MLTYVKSMLKPTFTVKDLQKLYGYPSGFHFWGKISVSESLILGGTTFQIFDPRSEILWQRNFKSIKIAYFFKASRCLGL